MGEQVGEGQPHIQQGAATQTQKAIRESTLSQTSHTVKIFKCTQLSTLCPKNTIYLALAKELTVAPRRSIKPAWLPTRQTIHSCKECHRLLLVIMLMGVTFISENGSPNLSTMFQWHARKEILPRSLKASMLFGTVGMSGYATLLS